MCGSGNADLGVSPSVSKSQSFTDAEREMLRETWPLDLLEDPARQPRIVTTAHEFLREILLGNHLDDFVLLPNGTELLELDEKASLPSDVLQALEGCSSVQTFLRRIQKDEALLDKYKAGIEYMSQDKEQHATLPKERKNLRGRVNDVLRRVDEGKTNPDNLYIAEMRMQAQRRHPIGGEKVKTVCLRDVKDVLGPYSAWSAYWDRHDEGVFIGNRWAGKGIHIDQVLWSNVGKNWWGYKLVAAWPKGEISTRLVEKFEDRVLTPPLSQEDIGLLQTAGKIILLRPGDVYLFSGGAAHTTLCVSFGLGLSAYESICSLNPYHVDVFLQTTDRKSPLWMKGAMDDSDFEDILDETVEQLEDVARQLKEGGPAHASTPAIHFQRRTRKSQFDVEKRFEEPCRWLEIKAGLHADGGLQRGIRDHFVATVAECTHRSSYLRKKLPKSVRRARQAILRCSGRDTLAVSRSRSRTVSVSSSHSTRSSPRHRSRSRSESSQATGKQGAPIQAESRSVSPQTGGDSV